MRKRLKVVEERLLETIGTFPTTRLHLECHSFALLSLCNVLDVHILLTISTGVGYYLNYDAPLEKVIFSNEEIASHVYSRLK
jgi:hypothetical protein